MPNGEVAVITIKKLIAYCLNPQHPDWQHKARVFFAASGMTVSDANELRAALADAAVPNDAMSGILDLYGKRYIVDFRMSHRTRSAIVRSCWLIGVGETVPRLITCFVL